MESRVLQVRVVLVRPEPVDFVIRHMLAEHVAGGSSALFDGVLPMFDSDLAVEDGVMVIRHVTSSINAADVCLAICVDDYAVVDVNAAAFEHFHGWLDADAGNDEIAVKTQTCLRDDARPRAWIPRRPRPCPPRRFARRARDEDRR